MKQAKLLVALALASSAFLPVAPAPVPGPGGVIEAVGRFLRAIDAGDAEALAALIDDHGDNLHDFAVSGDDIGAAQKAAPAAFYECGPDQRPWRADDEAAFVTGLATYGSRTAIGTVRANCLSERCSYAMVEFERVFGTGDTATRVPMRATALLRYDAKATPAAFRIYHWHASPGPAAAAK